MGFALVVYVAALLAVGVGLAVEALWWISVLAVAAMTATVVVDVARSSAP